MVSAHNGSPMCDGSDGCGKHCDGHFDRQALATLPKIRYKLASSGWASIAGGVLACGFSKGCDVSTRRWIL